MSTPATPVDLAANRARYSLEALSTALAKIRTLEDALAAVTASRDALASRLARYEPAEEDAPLARRVKRKRLSNTLQSCTPIPPAKAVPIGRGESHLEARTNAGEKRLEWGEGVKGRLARELERSAAPPAAASGAAVKKEEVPIDASGERRAAADGPIPRREPSPHASNSGTRRRLSLDTPSEGSPPAVSAPPTPSPPQPESVELESILPNILGTTPISPNARASLATGLAYWIGRRQGGLPPLWSADSGDLLVPRWLVDESADVIRGLC
ncbi:hypothetical protein BDK51DRAFT_45279 [Blyttiomyces helicus]|uniref:Uncharacterized protein n=1 Tax=Blyttiomyces helicus TaxID=388810 RepID=A0A4P9WFT8_9FUNG|nr:hypothetical protein BDK51DRAFT_45279 [Blyttiomyces helicus]|eukprot:RKO91639.1 hypothetical protein BDK51DRAFT_45279 [Blyttiomyces helicus]